MLKEAWQRDKGLFFYMVLQDYCFILPAELRRLKMADFDFEKGMIHLDKTNQKWG
jgi:integrase